MKKMKFTLMMALGLSLIHAVGHAQHCYWQQEVDYKMEIEMNVKDHSFIGSQKLTYTNNSPDVIDKVFYHLYFNAFQPGSMMDERNQKLPDSDPRVGERISGLKPTEEGHIHVNYLRQDGKSVMYQEEGTILEVILATPLNPGASTVLEMDFRGQVPIQIRRSGRDNAEGIDYSMAQSYPKLCEYDYRGWHANPYIGREFYGVWGDFDVTIKIDKKYMVAASGVLQNADEIGFGYSDRKKPMATKGKVAWNFVAENVHDFVWAADPDYTHVVRKAASGTELHFFYQEGEDTEAWVRLPEIMDDALTFMNKKYGEYPYPVYSFIQGGDGGMEYAMATLITGHRSLGSLVGVSVHELFHSWYQMVLGTDEARFAWMDEGFTSYGSAVTMNYLREKHDFGRFIKEGELFKNNITGFANFTKSGLEEPLSVHSDHFATNAAYGVGAYSKGAIYLVQMRYLIGEENFDQLMLDYYNTWKFKHPEPHHFLRIAERISGLELDWFNQYFINTTQTMDYGLDTLWSGNGNVITLSKIGRFPMPVDVRIDYTDGTSSYHTIPLRIMRGAKEKEKDITYKVEPDWPWTRPQYDLRIDPSKSVRQVTIDPSDRMADVDRTNNVWKRE